MITDEQLRTAAQELDDALMASLPEPDDSGFSPHFQRKMKKLIQRAKHTHHFNWGRCIAAILTTILMLSGAVLLSEYNARADYAGLYDEDINGHYYYHLNTNVAEDAPKAYRLGSLPEGYTVRDYRDRGSSGFVYYISEAERGIIRFSYTIGCAKTGYGFGGEMTHRETWINGESADLFTHTKTGSITIIWTNHDRTVLFAIGGKISEAELIRMAESVVPYELE